MDRNIFTYLRVFLVIFIMAGCSEKLFDPPDTMRNIDGNLYRTIKIGWQV